MQKTRNPLSSIEDLENLTDAIVEDILLMSDKEIMEETSDKEVAEVR